MNTDEFLENALVIKFRHYEIAKFEQMLACAKSGSDWDISNRGGSYSISVKCKVSIINARIDENDEVVINKINELVINEIEKRLAKEREELYALQKEFGIDEGGQQ